MTITESPITGSALVAALESVYASAQERHPELPDVIFITGTGLMGRGAKWGHYWADAWKDSDAVGRRPEVFIAGERLACGAADVLETILHEAAHALAVVRGIQDVSRDRRYHNRRFLALAEELGLCFLDDAPHASIGFSNTALTEATLAAYAQDIATLDAAILASMDTFDRMGLTSGNAGGEGAAQNGGDSTIKVPTKGPSRTNPKAACSCGRVIRASRKVLAEAPILCGLCGGPFLMVDTEGEA